MNIFRLGGHSDAFGGIKGHSGAFGGTEITAQTQGLSHTENIKYLIYSSTHLHFCCCFFLNLKIKEIQDFEMLARVKGDVGNDDTDFVCLPDMSWSRTVSKGGQKGLNNRKTYKTSPCLVSTRRDRNSGLTFNWHNSSEIIKQQLQDLMNLATLVLKWATCM